MTERVVACGCAALLLVGWLRLRWLGVLRENEGTYHGNAHVVVELSRFLLAAPDLSGWSVELPSSAFMNQSKLG